MIVDDECSACGGQGEILGVLGRRVHLRCRNCGIDFSYTASDDDVAEILGDDRGNEE